MPAAFLHLFGKSYLVMRNPRHNNSNIDNFLLPQQLLYDGAVKDLGEHYAGQLCRVRSYLQEHHPFARRLRVVDDMDGERIDLSGCIRIEAHSEKSGAMELAFLDSGVRPPGTESNKVLYFDLGRAEQNLSPNVTVSRHSAMYAAGAERALGPRTSSRVRSALGSRTRGPWGQGTATGRSRKGRDWEGTSQGASVNTPWGTSLTPPYSLWGCIIAALL